MDFKSALNKVSKEFNKEIIFERRVISILDDYGAFNDTPYHKLYYKTIISSGNLSNLISQSDNIRDKEIFTFVSRTGLDENKLRIFLSIIYECYYRIPLTSKSKEGSDINHSADDNIKSNNKAQGANSSEISTEDHIAFMGKELGCPVQEMIEYLLNKGFSKINGMGNPKLKGDFAGFKDARIVIWSTPSSKVWNIAVEVKSNYDSLKKIYNAKYTNMRIDATNRNVCYTDRLLYDINGGTIRLSKGSSNNRIEYIDSLTRDLNYTELKMKEDLRRQQQEDELNQQIDKAISDI